MLEEWEEARTKWEKARAKEEKAWFKYQNASAKARALLAEHILFRNEADKAWNNYLKAIK